MILVLAFAVINGAALLIIPLVVSAGIVALCFAESQAFRRPNFGVAAISPQAVGGNVLAVGTPAAFPPSKTAASRPLSQPAVATEATMVANAATNCRVLFKMFLVVLAGVGIIIVAYYAGWNPAAPTGKQYKAATLADHIIGFVTNGFSLLIWGGAAFAAIYLPMRWQVIRSLPAPVRRRGRVGGFGLIAVALLTLASVFADPTSVLPARGVDGPTFAEFDAKFGLSSVVNGRPRVDRTQAQRQAELERYLGKAVQWTGTVLEAKDDAVLIGVGPSLGQQIIGDQEAAARRLIAQEMGQIGQADVQVVLKLAADQVGRARSLNKGQTIVYTGTLTEIGDPYPYLLSEAKVH